MITDFPGKKILRRMGYVSDQNGILNRYLSEAGQWNQHLDKTMSFITKSLSGVHPEHIVVLGSGWLLDLAIEELYGYCRQISLVDVNHPPQILHKIGKYPGINAVCADITGGLIEETYNMVQHCRKKGETFNPDHLKVTVPDMDEKDIFVISLNVLDQLDALIIDYINRWFNMDAGATTRLRKRIQQAHISMVSAQRYCIITDECEVLTTADDRQTVGKKLLHTPLPVGRLNDAWLWKFDNNFKYYEDYRTWFQVRAVSF